MRMQGIGLEVTRFAAALPRWYWVARGVNQSLCLGLCLGMLVCVVASSLLPVGINFPAVSHSAKAPSPTPASLYWVLISTDNGWRSDSYLTHRFWYVRDVVEGPRNKLTHHTWRLNSIFCLCWGLPSASPANACSLIDPTQNTSVMKDGRNLFIWLIAIAIIFNQ